MGFDLNRVSGFGKNHLTCNICLDVVEDVVQLRRCEHIFCKQCISQWIACNNNCPVDRVRHSGRTFESQITRPPLIILSVLNKLKISCEFASFGCGLVCNLDQIESHQAVCRYNANRKVICERGCGLELTIQELSDHSCAPKKKAKVASNYNPFRNSFFRMGFAHR